MVTRSRNISDSDKMLSLRSWRHVGPRVRGVSRRAMSAAALPQPITEPEVKVRTVHLLQRSLLTLS